MDLPEIDSSWRRNLTRKRQMEIRQIHLIMHFIMYFKEHEKIDLNKYHGEDKTLTYVQVLKIKTY